MHARTYTNRTMVPRGILGNTTWVILPAVFFRPYISESTKTLYYCSVLKNSQDKLQESVMRNGGCH